MISTNSADVIFDGVIVASVVASLATDGSYSARIEIKDSEQYIANQKDADASIQDILKNIQESSAANFAASNKK